MSQGGDQPSESNLQVDLSVVSNEIAELRNDLSDLYKNSKRQSEITRIQRAHLIVALGVISAFATLYTEPAGGIKLNFFWKSQKPIFALLIHAFLFLLYIPAHLAAITLKASNEDTRYDDIHDLLLPGANLFLLIGSLPLVMLVLINLDFSIVPSLRAEGVWSSGTNIYLLTVTPAVYLIVELIILWRPAKWYAKTFKKNMPNIETSSKSYRLKIGRGSSGDSARVTITNTTEGIIEGSDVRIEVDTPDLVELNDVKHCSEVSASTPTYELVDDLESNETVRIPIDVEPITGVKYDDYRGEEVVVDVYIQGERTSTERFTL